MYESELEFAKRITKKAGTLIKETYLKKGRQDFVIKSKGQIVTEADKKAEKIYVDAIQEAYPKYSIYSEELGKITGEGEFTWIIDPIDGTTNFSMQNPFFNTTIALMRNDQIVVGTVYAPMFNEFYYAVKDEGAFLNNEKISVSDNIELDRTFHAFCYGDNLENSKTLAANYYRDMLTDGMQVRQLGAAALELARVASGVMGSMIIPGANIWDVAAGVLLVEEAGGVALDLNSKTFSNESDFLLAANSPEMLEKVTGYLE
jgi:myo-inositol-1(or 4)-monophosphatase